SRRPITSRSAIWEDSRQPPRFRTRSRSSSAAGSRSESWLGRASRPGGAQSAQRPQGTTKRFLRALRTLRSLVDRHYEKLTVLKREFMHVPVRFHRIVFLAVIAAA